MPSPSWNRPRQNLFRDHRLSALQHFRSPINHLRNMKASPPGRNLPLARTRVLIRANRSRRNRLAHLPDRTQGVPSPALLDARLERVHHHQGDQTVRSRKLRSRIARNSPRDRPPSDPRSSRSQMRLRNMARSPPDRTLLRGQTPGNPPPEGPAAHFLELIIEPPRQTSLRARRVRLRGSPAVHSLRLSNRTNRSSLRAHPESAHPARAHLIRARHLHDHQASDRLVHDRLTLAHREAGRAVQTSVAPQGRPRNNSPGRTARCHLCRGALSRAR